MDCSYVSEHQKLKIIGLKSLKNNNKNIQIIILIVLYL
jgi:hypothetical protein